MGKIVRFELKIAV